MDKIFVYGTLLVPDTPLNAMLNLMSISVTPAYFKGKLFKINNIPFAVDSDNDSDVVIGKVYELREPKIIDEVLDLYEGCNGKYGSQFYTRERRYVKDMYCQNVETWVYLASPAVEELEQCEMILDGDWVEHITQIIAQNMDS